MRKKIIASSITLLAALSTLGIGTVAYFSDSVETRNNTFSTGNTELKLFYDCSLLGEDSPTTYTTPQGFAGVIVNDSNYCTDELNSLRYQAADGRSVNPSTGIWENKENGLFGDWTTANGWYDVISSPVDHTLIGPGWTFDITLPEDERDVESLGNAGDYPLHLYYSLNFEARDINEGREPEDSDPLQPHGGDRIDPYDDLDWEMYEGRTYSTMLADKIWIRIQIVTGNGVVSTNEGLLSALVSNGQYDTGYFMAPDETVNVRYTMHWVDSQNPENEYQNLYFDLGAVYEGRAE